jgi:hypothetical protein
VLGMREKIKAPADGAREPNDDSNKGKNNMRDERGKKECESEGGDNWPSSWRRKLDRILGFGVIMFHGQYRTLMK